jgi:hypothetical protein
MASRFKIRKRLSSTKLKVFSDKPGFFLGNSSVLMEKVSLFLDIGATTGASSYSAKTAAIDLAHAVEDYACSDYRCLALDCLASGCDLAAVGISFLPKNQKTGAAFAGCTAASKFSRTLRNRCKQLEKGLFGCKD